VLDFGDRIVTMSDGQVVSVETADREAGAA
jgi:hypothetical protein